MTNKKIIDLAKTIQKNVKIVPASNSGNYFTYVFLCGGFMYKGDNRDILKTLLSSRTDIRCLYSEELFQDIDLDLLSFEELLVEYSTNVIIILESYGSACELGAFTYIDKLLNKIIVVNDSKHKGKNTFINDGPIRKISNINKANVFYEEFIDDPTKGRPVLIVSTELYQRLVNEIPKEKTFKKDSLYTKDETLYINDILYFQIIIFEVINFFGPLIHTEIIDIIYTLYDTKKIEFMFESGNKINSEKDPEKFNKLLDFLLLLQIKFKILEKKQNYYYIRYSEMINDNLDFLNKNSLLFKSDFIKSKAYLKAKSRAIFISKKRGLNIWQN